jgi:hypothetical protein
VSVIFRLLRAFDVTSFATKKNPAFFGILDIFFVNKNADPLTFLDFWEKSYRNKFFN